MGVRIGVRVKVRVRVRVLVRVKIGFVCRFGLGLEMFGCSGSGSDDTSIPLPPIAQT